MIAALILAGGTGSRVGADRPKQFIEVSGKPVAAYTIEIYQNHPQVDVIEAVCHKDWKKYLEKTVRECNYDKVCWITDGGKTFQDSVIKGMKNFEGRLDDSDIVMIHYGAAPFTCEQIITDGIKVCKEKGMSASCIECYQLLGTKDDSVASHRQADRDQYIQIACPQSFRFSYLKEIYQKSEEKGILNDTDPHTTSLMYQLGEPVYQSYGNQANIKITTAEDIELFRLYVLGREKMKEV